jgi:hypothetical protein
VGIYTAYADAGSKRRFALCQRQALGKSRKLPTGTRLGQTWACYIRNTSKIQNQLNQNICQVLEKINQ